MTNLITLDNVSLAFGLAPLLDVIKLQIATGERICLIGRNGAGKSSLLKVLDGSLLPDSGTIWRAPHLRIARLTQELPRFETASVYEFVLRGLAEVGELLSAYHQLTQNIRHHQTAEWQQLETLQQRIDAVNGWQLEQNINTVLSRLELNADDRVANLSGGWQRRAALAQALVRQPDLLLLDEPTNHLDIAAIEWLEDYLLNTPLALVFITHDRSLLQRLATRILELDRGHLTSWPGDYANFLRRKEEMLHAEEKQNADFDKRLAQEERWIRQGIKARRTRNEGRVRALKAMRVERLKRREKQGKADFQINEAERSGQVVIEAQDITHAFNDKPLIQHFSCRIMRGDKIGLVGPNGVGKSTLLNILLGKLSPQYGTMTFGTKLQIAYSDQLRERLDEEKTVIDNVAEGRQSLVINGNERHIISYLADFLFTPERALTPVKALSGGERNRLLLARLFSQPFNVLVMDEPTNDLDIETLELLEELLLQFQGTLLLVSHDRTFLDNVVTSIWVFAGNGVIEEYIGTYQDWHAHLKPTMAITTRSRTLAKEATAPTTTAQKSKKLSYKEQRELENLPSKIEALEKEHAELSTAIAAPDFYKQNKETITQTLDRLQTLEKEIATSYARWDALSAF